MTDLSSVKLMGTVLIVSEDEEATRQLTKAMEELALSVEVCSNVSDALEKVNHNKFEAGFVDFLLRDQAIQFLKRMRSSASNRNAVTFAITSSTTETAHALKAGSSFALERPLTVDSIRNTLNAAYGLIVRERRRYFRYPISVPAAAYRKGEPEIFGKTVNISERGMAVTCTTPLIPGAEVRLQFSLTNPQLALTAECKVCWTNDRGQSGLSFLLLASSLSSELQVWLAQKLEEQLPDRVTRRFQ